MCGSRKEVRNVGCVCLDPANRILVDSFPMACIGDRKLPLPRFSPCVRPKS